MALRIKFFEAPEQNLQLVCQALQEKYSDRTLNLYKGESLQYWLYTAFHNNVPNDGIAA